MNIQELTAKCQDYCHQGRALDEVEILDKDGNIVCVLDDITLATDHGREVVQITVHHREKE